MPDEWAEPQKGKSKMQNGSTSNQSTSDHPSAIPKEVIDKISNGVAADLTGDKATEFINAIRSQITEADPKGTKPLVDYVESVQFRSRKLTGALQALVAKWVDKSGLSADEKTILKYWSKVPSGTIEGVFKRFGEGLADPADKELVDDWLGELTDRERSFVLTGALVGLDIDAGLFLAVNLFRALLAGVTEDKLLSALRICQIYCGLPAYVAASKTLVALGDLLREIPDAKITPAEVIKRLVKRFDVSF